MKTAFEWISGFCNYGASEYIEETKKFAELKVVKEFDGTVFPFPQTKTRPYRNVISWCLLEDGSSLGWNESPRNGFSFPRTGKKTTDIYMNYFKEKGMM